MKEELTHAFVEAVTLFMLLVATFSAILLLFLAIQHFVSVPLEIDPIYTPTQDLATTTISWVSNPAVVASKLSEYGVGTLGVSFNNQKNSCVIYVPEPKDSNDVYIFGHEVLHCFRGSFHK